MREEEQLHKEIVSTSGLSDCLPAIMDSVFVIMSQLQMVQYLRKKVRKRSACIKIDRLHCMQGRNHSKFLFE